MAARVIATRVFRAWMAAAVLAAGCTSIRPVAPVTAVAEIKNAQDRIIGSATLTQLVDGVRIIVEVRDLSPGLKGVHLHEVGACVPPDFTSAGEHFNPTRRQHGLMNPAGPHAGDLPNIDVGADRTGRLETTTDRITLGSGSTSLFDFNGSALVIHAEPDDHATDPDGGAGARIACGSVVKQ